MPREIAWLPGALGDMDRLRGFIKSDNPHAARRAAKRIIEAVKILQESPEAGVPAENLIDYKDLIVSFGAGDYIIRYRLDMKNRDCR